MRCDANVSLKPAGYQGSLEDLPRVEIKNVNSFRNVQRGIDYEVARQAEMLQAGQRIVKETRGLDDATGRTYSQRSKEEANDYRYFPEPDLPPLVLDSAWIDDVSRHLPDLPPVIRQNLMARGLSEQDAEVLVQDREAYEYWTKTVQYHADEKLVTNWMLSDVARLINARHESYATSSVGPQGLAELLDLMAAGTLSGRMAKEVLEGMFETKKTARAVVKALGLSQITDTGALMEVIQTVLANHAAVVADYRSGKDKALAFLVGQVMKATRGQAKPDLVNSLLKEAIGREE